MAEDTQTAQTPVTKTQETATPTVQEQKTPETSKESQDGLPEEASERTRQRVQEVLSKAERLEEQLKEERVRREQIESTLKNLSQPKPSTPEPIYDPNTGLIDGQQLTELQRKTNEAEQRALRAEQSVQGYLRSQEERVAYEAHPWLNPKAKEFDQDKFNLAAGIALASMVNPERFGDKQLDLKGAGDYVAKLTSAQVEKVKEEAAQQAIEQLSPKEQAALEATGSSARLSEMQTDFDELRETTRKGGTQGLQATMERLKALKTQA